MFVFGIFTSNLSTLVSFWLTYNVGHMRSGGVRSDSLSTEAEITIEVLPLVTHKPRHYLYAVLAPVFIHIHLL